MRPFRYEMLSMATILSLPIALSLAFPHKAMCFKASSEVQVPKATAAFVMLSETDEADAIKSARTAWQADVSARQRMRMYLPIGELPEDDRSGPLLVDEVRGVMRREKPPMPYGAPAWSPSLAAGRPERIAAGQEQVIPPAFSREELLLIKGKE